MPALIDFVMQAWERRAVDYPKDIALSDDFVEKARRYFHQCEVRRVEVGASLKLSSLFSHKWIHFGRMAVGDDTSINIPNTDERSNFGDLHAHPSRSVGYQGENLPLSGEDIMYMTNHAKKPIFCRFVVSGDKIYAMVHLNVPASAFVNREGECRRFIAQQRDIVRDMIGFYYDKHCPVPKADRDQRHLDIEMSDSPRLERNRQWREYQVEQMSHTPAYGLYCREAVIALNRAACQHCNLGFYVANLREGNTLRLD